MNMKSKTKKVLAFFVATVVAGLGTFNVKAAILRSYLQWVGDTSAQVVGLSDGNSAALHLETAFTVADGTDVVISDGPTAWYQHISSEFITTGVTVWVSGQNNSSLRSDATYDLSSVNGNIPLTWHAYNICDIYGETGCGFYKE